MWVQAVAAAALILAACTNTEPPIPAAPTVPPAAASPAPASPPPPPAASPVPETAIPAQSAAPAPSPSADEALLSLAPEPAEPLIVDDAATANPALVETEIEVPSGFPTFARTVNVPEGFSVSLLATGLAGPRFMTFDDQGNLLVAAAQGGKVYRYPAVDGQISPAATPPEPLLDGLNAPSSLALFDGHLYVGETNRVTRFAYDPNGPAGDREVVVPNLPTGGHSTRTVLFGPDGVLYVSVGSSCNICDERDERRAAILRYNPDGSGYERFAWGLRNAVGLAIQPGTGDLWATVNERDNQGNEIPPDLVTRVREGQNFGWPACRPPDATPQEPGSDCQGITPPTVGIQAHSAPLGLTFVGGSQFPPDFQGDLVVAQHGSWNRQPPAQPKLLRIHFAQGQPASVEDFLTGFQAADGSRWGRPAGVITAPDGSLIVSDDQGGRLFRVSYTGG